MQNSQADRRNVRLPQHVLAAETRENTEVRTAVVQRLCAVSIWLLGVETLSLSYSSSVLWSQSQTASLL